MEQSLKKPKVSVCVVTYNQEKYIRQCLQSIVDQKTDFDFEIIVGDDCSTDNTKAIVEEFSLKHPRIVKCIFQEKNIGASENYLSVHEAAIGDYIAHMDGDDYCLPGKLQAQANMLDFDTGCYIVFHRMQVMTPAGEIREGPLAKVKNLAAMRFDRGAFIQYMALGLHSSKMYRSKIREFDFPDFELIDYFVNVEQIGDGYARYLSHENFGVYRMGVGIASSGSKTRILLANSFIYFNNKYPEFRAQINTASLTYFLADLKNLRSTWRMFFLVWIKTFHVSSIFKLIRSLSFIKKLKLIN